MHPATTQAHAGAGKGHCAAAGSRNEIVAALQIRRGTAVVGGVQRPVRNQAVGQGGVGISARHAGGPDGEQSRASEGHEGGVESSFHWYVSFVPCGFYPMTRVA